MSKTDLIHKKTVCHRSSKRETTFKLDMKREQNCLCYCFAKTMQTEAEHGQGKILQLSAAQTSHQRYKDRQQRESVMATENKHVTFTRSGAV